MQAHLHLWWILVACKDALFESLLLVLQVMLVVPEWFSVKKQLNAMVLGKISAQWLASSCFKACRPALSMLGLHSGGDSGTELFHRQKVVPGDVIGNKSKRANQTSRKNHHVHQREKYWHFLKTLLLLFSSLMSILKTKKMCYHLC